jgi:hypothetical protein
MLETNIHLNSLHLVKSAPKHVTKKLKDRKCNAVTAGSKFFGLQ